MIKNFCIFVLEKYFIWKFLVYKEYKDDKESVIFLHKLENYFR